MRIAVTVSTPKHAHIWKNPVAELRSRGHEVLVTLRDYRETLPVARGVGLVGPTFGRTKGGGWRRMSEYPTHVFGHYRAVRKFRPDILSGTGVFEAHSGKALRRPAVAWTDTEHAPGHNTLIKLFADCVMVPRSFQSNQFGKKQLGFDSYLELAYLHPNRFSPDKTIIDDLGVSQSEPYALVRFNAWDATHDVNAAGFTNPERIQLVESLAKHGRVFISPEGDLPAQLEPYRIPTAKHRIHDVLSFASLYVGDSGTMQNEAAILGTPCVRYTNLPRELDRGNSEDLERNHGLMTNVRNGQEAITAAVATFADTSARAQSRARVQAMLRKQTDLTAFMVWFLENYPVSERMMREDSDAAQRAFRKA